MVRWVYQLKEQKQTTLMSEQKVKIRTMKRDLARLEGTPIEEEEDFVEMEEKVVKSKKKSEPENKKEDAGKPAEEKGLSDLDFKF